MVVNVEHLTAEEGILNSFHKLNFLNRFFCL